MTIRFPWLTATVAALTATVSVIGLVSPGVVALLGRDGPLISDGQLWRFVTSLLVQDGGVPGTVWNIAGLVVLGVLAEQACRRGAWLAAYLGAGLVGELVGWAGWQPVGAGNSVAVCGLAALLAVATARDTDLPAALAVAAAMWSLAVGVGPYLPAPVLVGAMIACGLAGRVPAAVGPGRIAVVVVAGSAVFAIAHADIHGAAIGAGLVGVVGAWLCGVSVRRVRERSDGPLRA